MNLSHISEVATLLSILTAMSENGTVRGKAAWGKARATRCDAAHLRWCVQKGLRCLKIAFDVLR